MEEDDDLAGPAPGTGTGTDVPASSASEAGEPGAGRTYTPEELEGMNVKQLGRLRAQGVDVDALLRQKKKAKKANRKGSKLATVQTAIQDNDEEEALHGDA
jgi:tRNA (guanine-N(7)-)-methyltransferase subunit TRM82